MKFKSYKQSNGTFFVNTHKKGGRQYGRTFTDELSANQFAYIRIMQHHQEQLDKAWRMLDETASKHDSIGNPILEGDETSCEKGDLLC